MKRISIIIPCYNMEKLLDRCFDSLCNQTLGMEHMELIFVNDASTDGTLEKLMAYEQQYPEDIIIINFEENRRQGAARNAALSYASAPYIGYVDPDDLVERTMFEKMLEVMERYDCDFVQCRWDYFSNDVNERNMQRRMGKDGYMNLSDPVVKREFIGTKLALGMVWDKIYKKTFLIGNDIFCPEQIRYEDIFFSYLVFIYAKSCYCMEDVLYHYYVNPKGTVQQKKQEYQFDKMTVTFGFLQTCIERGLMEENKENIEWLFLEKYYVYMLLEVFEEFPERAYDTYLEMKETIQEWVPDYKTNPYRQWKSNAFDHVMLKLLDYDLTREQFVGIQEHMLKKVKQMEKYHDVNKRNSE